LNLSLPFSLSHKLSLVPHINSLANFCSKQDVEEYLLHDCAENTSEVGPQVVPGVCERLIVSMSAQLHDGAVGEYLLNGSAEAMLVVQMLFGV
jgi:laminin beta 4